MFLRNLSKCIVASIFVIILVTAIVLQMIYFVPYEKVATFISAQNVPHTVVIETGYITLIDLDNNAYTSISEMRKLSDAVVTKRIDTTQLTTNIILTIVIVGVIYLLLYLPFIYKSKKATRTKCDDVELPYLDFNELAFADEETQAKVQKEYAEAMYRYVASKIK